MVLFFDLDGPLLDVSPRYVRLHHDLLGRLGASGMAGDLYWRRKRAVCTEESILAELGVGHLGEHYLPLRLELIETPEYLALDCPWPWALPVLQRLRGRFSLVLVTARARRPLLLEQLERLHLAPCFDAILSEAGGRDVGEQKARLIREYLGGRVEADHWMIGDTEADIAAGSRVGLRTAAVLSGIRDEERLRGARATHLLADIRELPMLHEVE